MLQVLSLLLFSTVAVISIAAIVATVKAELPHILRALGIDPAPVPPLHSTREPRVRVIRPVQAVARRALRAAA
ncbi:MAG: hypothetical protein ABW128_09895 [Rhizorhabdus sp.]